LRLEILLDDGFSNIMADGIDAGVRLGDSLDEHMVAVPVTALVEEAVVGSPAYFEQYGLPETSRPATAQLSCPPVHLQRHH
jgi:DNA-binding transcriptional LysR family regulator